MVTIVKDVDYIYIYIYRLVYTDVYGVSPK